MYNLGFIRFHIYVQLSFNLLFNNNHLQKRDITSFKMAAVTDPPSLGNITVMDISLLFYPPLSSFIKINVVPYIALFGFISNVSFLLVVYKVKQFHNGINILLVNLALADIFFLVTEVTQSVLLIRNSPYQVDFSWSPFPWACHVSMGSVHLFEAASLLFIVTISIDRYFAVCKPFQHRLSKHLRNIFFCGMPWVLSILLAVGFAFTFSSNSFTWNWAEKNVTLPNSVRLCESDEVKPAYFFLLNLAPYVISVFLNGALYFWILKTLKKTYGVNSRRSAEARMSAVRMLLFNWLVYLLCVSPNFLLLCINIFHESAMYENLESVCRALLVVNSSVNPLIYNAFNSRYRKAFVRVFSVRRNTRPTRVSFSAHSSVRTTKV